MGIQRDFSLGSHIASMFGFDKQRDSQRFIFLAASALYVKKNVSLPQGR
jgi:hypothetical protein